MKVIKPLTLGILNRPLSHQDKHWLVLVGLGFFRLGQSQQRFEIEARLWPSLLQQLPSGQAIDLVMPKPRSEYLVAGNAYPLDPEQPCESEASVQVGDCYKELKVFGNRDWFYGYLGNFKITTPQPIDKVSVSYASAFGGGSFSENPIGKGFNGNRIAALVGRNRAAMPNLEYPDTPINSHVKKYAPAAFGPIDLVQAVSSKAAGTYDQNWIDNKFPALADDIDFSVFNMAATDQRKAGFWVGGEAYEITGMLPEGKSIAGGLPSFRVRALVSHEWKGDSSKTFVDLPADTVWFCPEQGIGLMIYRNMIEVMDSDAMDVASVMLGYENSADEPRSQQHYETTLHRKLDKKTRGGECFNEAPLIPVQQPVSAQQEKPAAISKAQRRQELLLAELESDPDIKSALDLKLAHGAGELTAIANAQGSTITPPDVLMRGLTLDDIAAGGADLGEVLQDLESHCQGLKSEQEKKRDLELRKLQSQLGEANILKSQSDALQEALATAKILPIDLHPRQGDRSQNTKDLFALLSTDPDKEKIDAIEQQLDSQAQLQRKGLARQTTARQNERRLSPSSAETLGKWLADSLQDKQPMAGRDLREVTLQAADLSHMDLREMNFEGADLSHCDFSHADLSDTNFLDATLQGCNFSRATLTGTNFSAARCAEATFAGAKLNQCMMAKTDLSDARFDSAELIQVMALEASLPGADFQDARLDGCVFTEAEATGSKWQRANLVKTLFSRATLNDANFSSASLSRCVTNGVCADRSHWQDATLDRALLGQKSSFTDSRWNAASLHTCGMNTSDFSRSDFSDATLFQCDLSNSSFPGSAMEKAIMCKSLLIQTDLSESSLSHVDLHSAICRKTDFSKSDLSHANLVEADKIGVVLKKTDVSHVIEHRQ